ncbi:MAG: glycosyltransferase family 4 protein [Planctomycetota bacterium]|nr:glycosyltransferase family 4 protein [Planctomycetota bacterium]
MRLLMVSGDRQVAIGERGPFHAMQREFSRYFDRIDVLCPKAPGPVTVETIHDNVHFHPAPCGRRGMVRYIADRGAELIREHGHTLITSHDYGWFYNGVGSAALTGRTGVPYLSEIHHVPGVPVPADLRERFDKWVARVYVRWARHKTLGFRVVNQEEMPRLLRRWGVPAERIFILPSLYIDQDVFFPREVQAQRDLVFAGRMVTNKGVGNLLEAMAVLKREGMPVSGMFIGKGPLREKLIARAAQLGVDAEFVEWVDSPEDLAELYRTSRVVVCASTCEGGPRFTVEAMACGTPCVSTPVGVMGDLLADGRGGGLAGFHAHSQALALKRVLQDEQVRAEMGRNAAEIARPFEYGRAIGVYANGLRLMAGAPELTL